MGDKNEQHLQIMEAIAKLSAATENIQRDISEIKKAIEDQKTISFESNKKITELQTENTLLKNKINILESKEKKNNLMIYGLHTSENLVEDVINFMSTKLGITITINDIDNIYSIKNKVSDKHIISLKLVSYLQKQEVLKQGYKLKGTEISITHDYTYEERQRNKILVAHLKAAKTNNKNKVKLLGNKIIANGKSFSYDILKNIGPEQFLLEISGDKAVSVTDSEAESEQTEAEEEKNCMGESSGKQKVEQTSRKKLEEDRNVIRTSRRGKQHIFTSKN